MTQVTQLAKGQIMLTAASSDSSPCSVTSEFPSAVLAFLGF